MCLALYIAAEKPLPLIPWDENAPAFYVQELKENEEAIRRHFTFPNVYFAGSYEGCGCPFNYGRQYPSLEDDKEEIESAEKSVKDLVDYLFANQVQEIFACWMGDEEKHDDGAQNVSLEQISAKDFYFQERKLLRII